MINGLPSVMTTQGRPVIPVPTADDVHRYYQAHETVVLVIQVMTVEQSRAGIVGDEIDLDSAESRHIDGICHHARRGLFAHQEISKE
jgi:hypothetical protein